MVIYPWPCLLSSKYFQLIQFATLVSQFVRFIMQLNKFQLFHRDEINRHLVLGLKLTHEYCTQGNVFAMIFPSQWILSWAFVLVYKVECYFGSVAEKKNNIHTRTRNVSDENYCWMMTALGFRISPASWPQTQCPSLMDKENWVFWGGGFTVVSKKSFGLWSQMSAKVLSLSATVLWG